MADDESKLGFLTSFETLFDSGDYSDLKIAVGNTSFSAHQNIVMLRTSFFANATKPENGFKESTENLVTIKEHSAHSVWRFLKYCYTGDYPEESNNLALGEEDDLGSLRHPRVYALADMLDVPGLKVVTTKKFQTKLDTNWVTADFPGTIREIYSTTTSRDKDFRDVAVGAARNHLVELINIEDFKDVMYEYGEFSGALVLLGTSPAKKCRYGCDRNCENYCRNCGRYTT